MKAIGYSKSLPITEEMSLEAVTLPDPAPQGNDLLVEIKAVSVNPVDVKVRMRAAPETGHTVLGFDASGIVKGVGSSATLFKPGDEVFYAGAITRAGTNSELHVVDERIVGRKPSSLDHAQAAALPLTSITAWELLFERFGLEEGTGAGKSILVLGGAGGVGSILIQLARQLTQLTVIATASRDETRDWCQSMGAHHIIDHRSDIKAQLQALAIAPDYVAGLTGTEGHFATIAECIAPQGKFGLIDDPDPASIDISLIKRKSVSLHWEFMFTRSMFETSDIIEQHKLLSRVADLVDAGTLRSTMTENFGAMSVENLKRAHAHQESGRAIGKTVLMGF